MKAWLSSSVTSGDRRIIILGASARAAAQSVLRAGFEPWCIDLFADRDLRAVAPVVRCPRERYPQAMIDLLDDAPDAPVLLTGAMENHPEVVRAIAAKRPLLGCTPQQIETLRDPRLLRCGFQADRGRTIVKPRRSAGGRRIRFYQPGEPISDDVHLQPFIEGVPISAVFIGERCLGATRQIIGDERFGASGFEYAGSLGPMDPPPDLCACGASIAREHHITGLFGIDAVVDAHGASHPVEINPRYPASLEVIERRISKAIVFHKPGGYIPGGKAPGRLSPGSEVIDDLYARFDPDQVADVPDAGATVHPGEPICTVFAADLDQLHALAHRVYTRTLHECVAPTG